MISTSVEGVYEWQIKNTVTGEITGRGRAKNKIHPKMFYYSFPKKSDYEHSKHHNGANKASSLQQFGLSKVRLNPDEYINGSYAQQNGTRPKYMNDLRLSSHRHYCTISIEQNDSGEWCYTFKYIRTFPKGESGTYVALCGGYFDVNNYYGSPNIIPDLFSVVNLKNPITLNDIDELTLTYIIYQKCPSIVEPVIKKVNISGKEYTISILIHPPERGYTIEQNNGYPEDLLTFKGNTNIVNNASVYPRLDHTMDSSAFLVLEGDSGNATRSRLNNNYSVNYVENLSESYPTTHVKNKMRAILDYSITGKVDVIRWMVFGSVMEVKITPTLEKSNEEQFFLDWIITHEVPNAPE